MRRRMQRQQREVAARGAAGDAAAALQCAREAALEGNPADVALGFCVFVFGGLGFCFEGWRYLQVGQLLRPLWTTPSTHLAGVQGVVLRG